jgi:anti-sigma regulatory factor (Ser/Thr protein kinase)
MSVAYQRTIPADLESLQDVLGDLVALFERSRVPAKASHDAQLVCEELIVNAIRHALGARAGVEHRIDLSVVLGDSSIRIQIRDDLPLFDPTSVPLPVRATSLAAASAGARGLALVRTSTTLFRWHADGSRNVTDLEVSFGPRSSTAPSPERS